jgi:hypothetical protein
VTATGLLSLAAYRLWRLIAQDTISEPARDLLPARVREPVECPWCAGSWVTFIVAVAMRRRLPTPWPVAALAAASVVGFLGERR